MIEALAANHTDKPFDIGTLPRRPRCRKYLPDSHSLHLINELQAKDAVPVAQQITRRSLPGKCLPELLSRSLGGRMCRNSEMNNPTPMVCQNQKHVKDLKPNRRHSKEVH